MKSAYQSTGFEEGGDCLSCQGVVGDLGNQVGSREEQPVGTRKEADTGVPIGETMYVAHHRYDCRTKEAKRMVRRILMVSLVMALCASFCTGIVAAKKTTIQFWSNLPSEAVGVWWEEQFDLFESKYPDFEVKAMFMDGDQLKAKLEAALAAGTEPDMFFTIPGARPEVYARAGLLLPLDDILDTEAFSPGAIKACTYKGKVSLMPLTVNPCVIWFNREIYDGLGVSLPHQPTIDEFLSICGKAESGGYIPIALAGLSNWPSLFYYWAFNTRLGGSEAIKNVATGKGSFLEPSFIRAGEYAQELAEADVFPVGFNGIDYQSANGLFANEDAGMIYMGNWLMGMIGSQAKADFQLDYIRFPSLPDGRPDAETAIMGGMSAIGVSAKTENADAVGKFLNLFAGDLERARKYVDDTGMLSPHKGLEAATPLTLPYRLIQELEQSSDVFNWWDHIVPPPVAERLLNLAQPLFGLEITPEQFAQTMEEAAAQHIAR